MKKAMTMSITLVIAAVIALVVAMVLIVMFGGAMEKGNQGLTGSMDTTTGDETGVACNTHCATCCLSHDQTYCEDETHGAPSNDCSCPNCLV